MNNKTVKKANQTWKSYSKEVEKERIKRRKSCKCCKGKGTYKNYTGWTSKTYDCGKCDYNPADHHELYVNMKYLKEGYDVDLLTKVNGKRWFQI